MSSKYPDIPEPYLKHLERIWDESGLSEHSTKKPSFYIDQLINYLNGKDEFHTTDFKRENDDADQQIEEEHVHAYIKQHNLDGLKKPHLLFIATSLHEHLKQSGINVPNLSRDAKRRIYPLELWFYDNRDILSPWLKNMKIITVEPGHVTRQKKKD